MDQQWIRSGLEELERQGLRRRMRLVASGQGARVVLDGREVLLLSSNNYLGLADHPRLKGAAAEAAERYGVSAAASRLVSGTMELHEQLEAQLAAFKGAERALLFNSGYSANSGIIPALVGRGDAVFSDRLNHASIVDGIILSRAEHIRYPHNDMAALRRLLERTPVTGKRLIVTDGVFSMDGDRALLRELVELKREFGALLMLDDAHGTGVLGATGSGSAEESGVVSDVDIQMGTLGKALGGFGAYAAGSGDLISWLVNRARSFIFSTALPPTVLAPALVALDIVGSAEGCELRRQLQQKSERFRLLLAQAGLDTMGSTTQIVPVRVGGAQTTMALTERLLNQGIYAQGIRPPTVPAGSCRLRCTLMATMADEDVDHAAAAIIAAVAEHSVA
ncbi:MAG TPA: 8-amino-7-oxononanoate synthase [Geobacterales bacterium]|nr:8-amino-7-oxononanoate synthase [Geobacterales bacterium]